MDRNIVFVFIVIVAATNLDPRAVPALIGIFILTFPTLFCPLLHINRKPGPLHPHRPSSIRHCTTGLHNPGTI